MDELDCPHCGAVRIVKNGHAHTGRQRYIYRVCGYQLTLDHSGPAISASQVALVDQLLTERISHRGICRVVGVSRTWFRQHLQALVESVLHSIDPAEVASSKG